MIGSFRGWEILGNYTGRADRRCILYRGNPMGSQDIEYKIRKYQRAIGVIRRMRYSAHQGGEKRKRADILGYAYKIIELKRELLKETGRCSPVSERWPV